MRDLRHHTADRGCIFALHYLVQASETESLDHELMFLRRTDLGPHILDLDGTRRFLRALLFGSHLELLHRLAAQSGDGLAIAQFSQSVEGGLDHIVRVSRA